MCVFTEKIDAFLHFAILPGTCHLVFFCLCNSHFAKLKVVFKYFSHCVNLKINRSVKQENHDFVSWLKLQAVSSSKQSGSKM